MRQTKTRVYLVCFLSLFLLFSVTFTVLAKTWSGTIIDSVTGEPVEGVEVKAGVRGRVDAFPGYLVKTDRNGRFSVTWPQDKWGSFKGDTENHYLRIEKDDGYLRTTCVRERPEENLLIELIPLWVHIKGQLIDGEDQRPLKGIRMALGVPGRIEESVDTDDAGFFEFKPARLHQERRTVYNYPLGLGLDYEQDPGPFYDYRVMIYGNFGYNRDPVTIPPEVLVPSADGTVHSFIIVEADSQVTRSKSAEVRGLKSGYGRPTQGKGCNCEKITSLAGELRGMINRAENNNAAHPNFISDLYRWLDELEQALSTSTEMEWGTY